MSLVEALSPSFTLVSMLSALSGGSVLAVATISKLRMNGNILGISGIVGGLVKPDPEKAWRLLFTGGLVGAGALMGAYHPESTQPLPSSAVSLLRLAVAGLLVGVGTSLGNGCTSGHGISGLTRFSPRSLAATCTFMATGALTATLANSGGWTDGTALASSSSPPASDGPLLAGKIASAYLALMAALAILPVPTAIGMQAVELASGLAFGLALGVSGMARPSKVTHFLDLSSGLAAWDPTLAFVMGGALCLTVPVYHLWVKDSAPKFASRISLPTKNTVDTTLLMGAALFGCGWGLAGVCPGPSFVSLGATFTQPGMQSVPLLTFLATMMLGWGCTPLLKGKN